MKFEERNFGTKHNPSRGCTRLTGKLCLAWQIEVAPLGSQQSHQQKPGAACWWQTCQSPAPRTANLSVIRLDGHWQADLSERDVAIWSIWVFSDREIGTLLNTSLVEFLVLSCWCCNGPLVIPKTYKSILCLMFRECQCIQFTHKKLALEDFFCVAVP